MMTYFSFFSQSKVSDFVWSNPYNGAFDHLENSENKVIDKKEAFFTTDLLSGCKQKRDSSADEYNDLCYKVGIQSSNKINSASKDSSIVFQNYGLDKKDIYTICFLLNENPSLQSIDLSRNQIGPIGCVYLSQVLPENNFLSQINLSSNKILDYGIVKLVDFFPNSELQILEISNNGLTDKSIPSIFNLLKEKSKLKNLDLHNNFFGFRIIINDINKTLALNKTLERIDFSWNNIRHSLTTFIFQGLKGNESLVYLDLSHNYISDDSCISIGPSISANKTLQYLDLSFNFITDKGAQLIANGLGKNQSITSFKIGFNLIRLEGVYLLMKAIHTNDNSAITKLGFEGLCLDSRSFVLWKEINDKRNKIDVTFFKVVEI